MNLRYTPQAMLDLQEIDDYISNELQNPDAAQRIIASIARDAARLKESPYLGFDLSGKSIGISTAEVWSQGNIL